MPLTYFLAQLIGLYCLILGMLMLFRKKVYVDLLDGYYREPGTVFLPGLIITFLGLMMILSHNYWSAGTLALIVTLVGWTGFIKGIMLMFFPGAGPRLIEISKARELSWLYGAFLVVVGAWLAYAGLLG